MSTAGPPSAETRVIALAGVLTNRMTPSRLHAPPTPTIAFANLRTKPPSRSSRLKNLSA